MYQVLYRGNQDAEWAMYSSPTSDPFSAMRLLQQARARHGHATVVQAATPSELALLVRRMLRRDLPEAEAERPTPASEPAHGATISASGAAAAAAAAERRRWEIERGPGGDHDQPYRFELPASAAVIRHWLRLLARYQREIVTSQQGAGAA